jgi:hypothetical protein
MADFLDCGVSMNSCGAIFSLSFALRAEKVNSKQMQLCCILRQSPILLRICRCRNTGYDIMNIFMSPASGALQLTNRMVSRTR